MWRSQYKPEGPVLPPFDVARILVEPGTLKFKWEDIAKENRGKANLLRNCALRITGNNYSMVTFLAEKAGERPAV